MFVTVRLFARLREIAGANELRRELADGATARTAWTALAAEFPGLSGYDAAISCAINEEYAKLTTTLKDGDEVAFLPPVSGGDALQKTEDRRQGDPVDRAFQSTRKRRNSGPRETHG